MKKCIWSLVGSGVAIISLAGCSSVGVQPVSVGSAKPANCTLDQYASERDIERPHEVACVLTSKTGTTLMHDKSASAAIDNARADACACGADAIVVESAEEEGITLMTWGQGKATLKAMRYLD
ncbi:hypothetical protein R5M92_08390 [Halomonas sp. Bachu 37]|uniref:hypothetical protein n=1 Tax=Halomonas kashgarensis TaxID=3084920 RepID=UPI0032169099